MKKNINFSLTMERTIPIPSIPSSEKALSIKFRVRAETTEGHSDWTYSNLLNLTGWLSYTVGTRPFYGIATNNDTWVLAGNSGWFAYSRDGMEWDYRIEGGTGRNNAIHYANGRWVMAKHWGEILISGDGEHWESKVLSTESSRHLFGVYNHNGRWVVVGYYGLVSTSTDGSSWNTKHIGEDRYSDIHNHNGEWMAVGLNGRVSRSIDGLSWVTEKVGENHYQAVSYYDGMWILVGGNGQISQLKK